MCHGERVNPWGSGRWQSHRQAWLCRNVLNHLICAAVRMCDLRRVSLQAALWKSEKKKKKSLELCKCYCFFEKLFANWQETLPFFGFATFAFHQISKQPAEGSGQYLEVVECRSWKDGQSCFISNLLKICLFSPINTVGWCTVAVPPEVYCSAWIWFHLQMLEWRNVIFELQWMVRCT